MNDAADLIDALSGFAWPILIVVILLLFKDQIGGFIQGADEATVKAGSFEASVKRTATAAVSLAHAERKKSGSAAEDVDESQLAASAVAQAAARIPDQEPRVLWVDDEPDNNRYERQAFEQLGISVEIARSTDDALRLLESDDSDVVITDMGRPEGSRAGYDLLEKIQKQFDSSIPVIIYSSDGSSEEHQAEAKSRGAYASTDGPTQLLQQVTAALAARAGNQKGKDGDTGRWARFKRSRA